MQFVQCNHGHEIHEYSTHNLNEINWVKNFIDTFYTVQVFILKVKTTSKSKRPRIDPFYTFKKDINHHHNLFQKFSLRSKLRISFKRNY